jgi:hypothetical protein
VADWRQIADAGFAVPTGADLYSLAAEMAEALADPDPRIRDGAAYATPAAGIKNGTFDAQLAWLGGQMAARLSDPRIQAVLAPR